VIDGLAVVREEVFRGNQEDAQSVEESSTI
jgi:hypothetical protein